MLALLFEVTPKPDGYQRYLDIAGRLRSALDNHDGFLFIDRYRSLSRPDTILSHSLWRDEASLAAWRTFEPHHHAQVVGREKVFADYRLRIADVVCVRMPGKADWRPERLSSYNEPSARTRRYLAIAMRSDRPSDAAASETFESLAGTGEFLCLYDLGDLQAAMSFVDALAPAGSKATEAGVTAVRICEVERDYGMYERREAPQYYPPVPRGPIASP
jgi:heme-degrading monooxygenase HmoA